jgi:hypothetical protein
LASSYISEKSAVDKKGIEVEWTVMLYYNLNTPLINYYFLYLSIYPYYEIVWGVRKNLQNMFDNVQLHQSCEITKLACPRTHRFMRSFGVDWQNRRDI